MRLKFHGIIIIIFCAAINMLGASNAIKDSTKKYKEPKHYIKSCVYLSHYATPEKKLKDKTLQSYQFTQSNFGFYIPLFTKNYYKNDSLTIANLHLLLTGNAFTATPTFWGLKNDHGVSKSGLGFRAIYNNGKKNIWFYDLSPFVVQDNFSYSSYRYSSVIVFNRTVNANFSYRIGITKTFMFGNRLRLPVAGLRFGPLDGTYLSIQFPRSISLNFPMGKKFYASIYAKPIGGLYNFTNTDSLYKGRDSLIQFGRSEVLNGIRLDYNSGKAFSFFIGFGITKFNKISFASFSYEKNTKGKITPFYDEHLPASGFINFGLTARLGKAKKAYNYINMYDVFDLNDSFDPGDNNDTPAGTNIPRKGDMKDIKRIQYKDIEDLIRLDDMY